MSNNEVPYGKMQSVMKWAGGKERELKYIIPNLPPVIERYFEPFVGGGSVFMNVPASRCFVNDLSSELICLYRCLAVQDSSFFHYAGLIDASWCMNARLIADVPAAQGQVTQPFTAV